MPKIDPKKKVAETLEIAEKICNDWEIEFLQHMKEWKGEYTEKQLETINKLYQRACNSPY